MPLVCVLRISVFSHLDSYELKQAHSVAIFGHELISIYRQPNWLGEAEDSTRTEAISSNLKQSQAISSKAFSILLGFTSITVRQNMFYYVIIKRRHVTDAMNVTAL